MSNEIGGTAEVKAQGRSGRESRGTLCRGFARIFANCFKEKHWKKLVHFAGRKMSREEKWN